MKVTAAPAQTAAGPRAYYQASALALVLLIASGMGFRAFKSRYLAMDELPRLKPGTLAGMPLTLGPWIGKDQPIDPGVLQLTATDDHVNRRYYQPGTNKAVNVFIGYGARPRDLMPHRPEICYPASGWAMVSRKQVSIPLADGTTVPAMLYHFHRSGLANARIAALSYWLVEGNYYADIADFRWQVLRPGAGGQFVVQMHVSSIIQTTPEAVDEMVIDFITEAAAPLYSLVTRAMEDTGVATRPTR